jgi:DNA-directed RNA polymerase I, II, and III subunit RPABC2
MSEEFDFDESDVSDELSVLEDDVDEDDAQEEALIPVEDEEEEGYEEIEEDDLDDIEDDENTINISDNHKFEIVSKDKTYERIESRKRICSPMMSTHELTKIIGIRAQQLSCGMNPMVIVSPDIMDTKFIAIQELLQKKMPLILRRFLPNDLYEDWRVEDLIIPKTILF